MKRGLAAGLMALALSLPVADRAQAAAVRSCGDLPATRTHNDIANVTTRGLSCRTARRAAVRLFHCPASTCSAVGRVFHCSNLGAGESVDERCVAHAVVVRFQTGV